MKKIVSVDLRFGEPDLVYTGSVVKSGNGAVVYCRKQFLGRKATVIVHKEEEATKK